MTMFVTFIFVIILSSKTVRGLQQKYFSNEKTIFEKITDEMNKKKVLRAHQQQIKQKWIEQPLDHFDDAETRKFKMRFIEDFSFWKPNGPIFIYIGGEGPISEAISSLLLYQIAKEVNGLVIATEHRYYGKSLPPLNLNLTANLKFLNSRQALADLAFLIKRIKLSPQALHSKVVVSGCSYAASLAVWMKALYPELIHGAISSSGTILAKKDYFEYFDTAGRSLKQYGLEGCYESVEQMFNRYEKSFESSTGIAKLKKEENICPCVDMVILENKQHFFYTKMTGLLSSAQFGTPYDIQWNCSHLMVHGKIDPIDFVYPHKGCNNHDFIKYVAQDWMPFGTPRCWLYQTCTEFGSFANSGSGNNPFTKNFPLEFHLKKCFYAFGPEFNEQRVDRGVTRTNQLYGGLNPKVKNVLFVNGEIDPWKSLCRMKPLPGSRLIIIPDGTHCKDIYYINDDDLPEVKRVKKDVIKTVQNWLLKDH